VDSSRGTIDELYQRLNRRLPDALELCHQEVEWFWPQSTPGASVFRGHAEVRRGFDQWSESWDELAMDPVEIFEEGEYALVMTMYRMRGVGSGVYIEERVAHLHQFEDGLLRRWWMFGDADKAKRRFLAGDRPTG
jgi:ketosteroid isomerase-like protein